jgi:hypothetical protein
MVPQAFPLTTYHRSFIQKGHESFGNDRDDSSLPGFGRQSFPIFVARAPDAGGVGTHEIAEIPLQPEFQTWLTASEESLE